MDKQYLHRGINEQYRSTEVNYFYHQLKCSGTFIPTCLLVKAFITSSLENLNVTKSVLKALWQYTVIFQHPCSRVYYDNLNYFKYWFRYAQNIFTCNFLIQYVLNTYTIYTWRLINSGGRKFCFYYYLERFSKLPIFGKALFILWWSLIIFRWPPLMFIMKRIDSITVLV